MLHGDGRPLLIGVDLVVDTLVVEQ